MHRIEDAHPNYLAQLLAPPPLPYGKVLSPQPLATTDFSAESSNSVAGPIHKEDEE